MPRKGKKKRRSRKKSTLDVEIDTEEILIEKNMSTHAVADVEKKVMLPNLTGGSIIRILEGQEVTGAVIQILGCKRIPGSGNDRYRLLISDGVTGCPFAMLGTQLNSLVTNKELEKFTVARIDKCVCNLIQPDRKIIILLNLVVLVPGAEVDEKIGNPVNFDASSDAAASANATENLVMLPTLTGGSINRILDGQEVTGAVIQILGCKMLTGLENYRYRLLISDGITGCPLALLCAELNPLVTNKELEKFTVVRIDECVCEGTDRKIIILLNLVVLIPGAEVGQKIGNPINSTTSSAAAAATSTEKTAENNVEPKSVSTIATKGIIGTSQVNGSAQAVHPIASLTPCQNEWTIKARVTSKTPVRTWNNSRGEGKLFSVNLLDESGEIRATGFNDAVDKFYDLIELNKVYYVSRATLKTENKNYSTVNNDNEMTFNEDTSIVPCEVASSSIPMLQQDFVSTSNIENNDNEMTFNGDTSIVPCKEASSSIPMLQHDFVSTSNIEKEALIDAIIGVFQSTDLKVPRKRKKKRRRQKKSTLDVETATEEILIEKNMSTHAAAEVEEKVFLPNLTAGSIIRILEGKEVTGAVMQILGCKNISKTVDDHHYQLQISDGLTQLSFAVLDSNLNHLVTNKELEKFTIVRVDKCDCTKLMPGCKKTSITIFDIAILVPGKKVGGRVGNPVYVPALSVALIAKDGKSKDEFGYMLNMICTVDMSDSVQDLCPKQRSASNGKIIHEQHKIKLPNLTAGSIKRILEGQEATGAIIQILICKMNPSPYGTQCDLLISDGTQCYHAYLDLDLNHLITNKELEKFAVVRLDEYFCNPIRSGGGVIILHNLVVLVSGALVGGKIGNPILFNAPATNATENNTESNFIDNIAPNGISVPHMNNYARHFCKNCIKSHQNGIHEQDEDILPSLTAGSIDRILRGEQVTDAVVQILDCRLMHGYLLNYYRLSISDGVTGFPFTMLVAELNSLVTNKELEKFTIVKVKKCAFKQIQPDYKTVILLDVVVLAPGAEIGQKIGNPVNFSILSAVPTEVPQKC